MSVTPLEPVAAETVPGKPSFWRAALIYALFCAYGAGSSWLVVCLVWLQLPVYEERFGLDLASKMTMGYQTGALAVPGFMLARYLLSLMGRRINYAALIWATLLSQAAVFVLGIADAHHWWVPVLICILGGFLGYGTDAVHQGYILMNFDILYVGAYWVGGDLAGLYAAGIAVAQEPGLGKEGRRFGPGIFYLLSLWIVPMSMTAFWFVNHFRPGALQSAKREQRGMATNNGHAQSETGLELPQSATATGFLKDVEELGIAGDASHSTDSGALLKKESEVALLKKESEAAPAATVAKGTWRSLLPQGLRTKPWLSFMIVATSAWIEFGCWGVIDPIYSYACANGSKEDKGLSCVADITEGNVVVILLGRFAGSAVLRLGHRCMKPCIGVFFSLFNVVLVLVSLAASLGGIWSSLGGAYVVAIVLLLRFSWSVIVMLNLAVLQAEYDESEVEDMNIFASLVGQVSSVLGTILVSVLIAEGEIS